MSPKLPPDLGGVFDSDAHRRVLAFCRAPHDDGEGAHEAGAPMSLTPGGWERSLSERMGADVSFFTSGADLESILNDLERAGYVELTDEGVRMTDEGFDALNGPNANEPPPMTEAMVNALVEDGQLDDDQVAAWREAHDAYHSEEE